MNRNTVCRSCSNHKICDTVILMNDDDWIPNKQNITLKATHIGTVHFSLDSGNIISFVLKWSYIQLSKDICSRYFLLQAFKPTVNEQRPFQTNFDEQTKGPFKQELLDDGSTSESISRVVSECKSDQSCASFHLRQGEHMGMSRYTRPPWPEGSTVHAGHVSRRRSKQE
jgi:hypothetical protein